MSGSTMGLSDEDGRYSRQVRFGLIGEEGQRKLAAARVLVVGCGALGTHLAEFCIRAGVGRTVLVDRDLIELSNLQRQTLFTEADVQARLPKAVAAANRLREINSEVRVEAVVADFDADRATALADGVSMILDATDNFETRLLINDLAVKRDIPWVYAGCVGARAAVMPVIPGVTACLSCLLEGLPGAGGATCDSEGVILPAVWTAVALASAEALKILSGRPEAVIPKLKTVDIWSGERSMIDASKPREGCPACGERRFAYLEEGAGGGTTVLCGRNSVQVRPPRDAAIDWSDLAFGESVSVLAENAYLRRLAIEGLEITLFADGRALVHGTADQGRARAIYTRLLGF